MSKHGIVSSTELNGSAVKKKAKLGESPLPDFMEWCQREGMTLSPKVGITENCSHRFGMVALQPIKKSEILFEIPRSMLLWECNYTSTTIPGLDSLDSKSGWVKLLLVLMLEYTDPNSKWGPYMQFTPPPEVMDTPIYWSSDVRTKILGDTPLLALVEKDIQGIEEEYKNIALPFIEKKSGFGFDKNKHTLDLYKHMVGFIMAYSFTEPAEDADSGDRSPKMVPMADVLNHVSQHNAHLQFDTESLKMVATQDISLQSEVFNTYGYLSNCQLLQMYGYVEEGLSNIHDSVEIPVNYFKNVPDTTRLEEKWQYLFGKDNGILLGCEVLTVGRDGILSIEEAKTILKVMAMSSSEFDSQREEEWESDSSESSTSSDDDSYSVHAISYKAISLFSPNWKSLLKFVGQKLRAELLSVLNRKEKMTSSDNQNTIRRNKVCTILKSQISILDSLIQCCLTG